MADLKRIEVKPELLNRGDSIKRRSSTEPTEDTASQNRDLAFGLKYRDHTFENFRAVKGTTEALTTFRNYAESLKPPFLLCYGAVGNGKTHLLEALALRLEQRGIRSTTWVVPEMLAWLKQKIGDPFQVELDQVIQNYQTGTLPLLLDDLGVEYGTPWEISVLERIILGRYRERVPTVVTTNRDLDELPERVISRFYEPGLGQVVLNDGKDYRKRRSGAK